MTERVYIGMGANLGDPPAQLAAAQRALDEAPGTRVVARSALYRTEPWGAKASDAGEPEFWNAVVAVETALAPEELLAVCAAIERSMGRRDPREGPRAMDLDLLLWGARVMRTPQLTLPHPRLRERRFVLAPLAEVAPDARHPEDGRTMRELLAACTDAGRVEKQTCSSR